MKLNKEKFMKTELGENLNECIRDWDRAIELTKKYEYGCENYRNADRASLVCQAQWEVYKMTIKQFYGVEYNFTRTDEYFGLVTDDEKDWLLKVERQFL